jgi:hypothetical protein
LINDMPCVIGVGPNPDFSTVIDDLTPAFCTRPDSSDYDHLPQEDLSRTIIVGANARLSSRTSYMIPASLQKRVSVRQFYDPRTAQR